MHRIFEFFLNFFTLLLPICVSAMGGYLLLTYTPGGPWVSLVLATIGAVSLMIYAFWIYHVDGNAYLSYGCALASPALMYVSLYQSYVTFRLFAPVQTFWLLTTIALAAAYASVRFKGWLLAVLAIALAIASPSIMLSSLSRLFLAWYLMGFLAISLLVAYWREWFELAVLSFVGFLLYNPLLFAYTDLEGKRGLLSIYQVFHIMAAFFCIYTLIPYIYSFFRERRRIFEGVSITIGGAYSFALIQHVIQVQLTKVQKLPFFIRFFTGKHPNIQEIYYQLFVLFGLIYLGLCLLLYIINRRAKVTIATLLSLSMISFIGAFYAQKQGTIFLRYTMRARRGIRQTLRMLR